MLDLIYQNSKEKEFPGMLKEGRERNEIGEGKRNLEIVESSVVLGINWINPCQAQGPSGLDPLIHTPSIMWCWKLN